MSKNHSDNETENQLPHFMGYGYSFQLAARDLLYAIKRDKTMVIVHISQSVFFLYILKCVHTVQSIITFWINNNVMDNPPGTFMILFIFLQNSYLKMCNLQ